MRRTTGRTNVYFAEYSLEVIIARTGVTRYKVGFRLPEIPQLFYQLPHLGDHRFLEFHPPSLRCIRCMIKKSSERSPEKLLSNVLGKDSGQRIYNSQNFFAPGLKFKSVWKSLLPYSYYFYIRKATVFPTQVYPCKIKKERVFLMFSNISKVFKSFLRCS